MVTTYNPKDMVKFGGYIASLIERGMKQPNEPITTGDFENWKVGEYCKFRRDGPLLRIYNQKRGVQIEIHDPEDVISFEECRSNRLEFDCEGLLIRPWEDDDWFWQTTDRCTIYVGNCPIQKVFIASNGPDC